MENELETLQKQDRKFIIKQVSIVEHLSNTIDSTNESGIRYFFVIIILYYSLYYLRNSCLNIFLPLEILTFKIGIQDSSIPFLTFDKVLFYSEIYKYTDFEIDFL